MTTVVPLIPPVAAGPLGLVHLPRVWLKARLRANGLLPEGYRCGVGGFDGLILEGVGVDGAAFTTFVESERPSYLATENWLREQATHLSAETIAATNETLLARQMPPEPAQRARTLLGLDDSVGSGAVLNALDDWHHEHFALLEGREQQPVIPAISSSAAGPLGALHLPRLWLKARLKADGLLPAGYESGPGKVDGATLEALGVPMDESVAFINSSHPSYLQYEGWVRERGTNLSAQAIATWNTSLRGRVKPDERAAPERAEVGLSDASVNGVIMLNDLLDWAALHERLSAPVSA